MDRLIIERIEGRILLGITMFLAIMILIGWVAINEPARMASFEEQQIGRSTERGAELYAANCSTCHGNDGRGIAGRAPALNNPMFFGFDFVATVNGDIGRRQRTIVDFDNRIAELTTEREQVFEQIGGLTAEQRSAEEGTNLVNRLSEIDQLIAEYQTTIDTLNAEIEPMLVERDARIAEMQTARQNGYLPELDAKRALAESENNPLILTNYIAEDSSRLSQIGWGGDLRGYITTTLIHGRPGSADVWGGNAMVAWSQRAGGPLRDDEIGDIVNYILNFDKGDNWTVSDLNQVSQFALIHADARLVSAGGDGAGAVGTNVENILADFGTVTGDATRGEALYVGAEPTGRGLVLGCAGCHAGGAVGPMTAGTWSRTQNEHLADPALAGYTVEQYLIEAIVRPNDYVVAGFASGQMPQNFGDILTLQDIADLLAYLEAQG